MGTKKGNKKANKNTKTKVGKHGKKLKNANSKALVRKNRDYYYYENYQKTKIKSVTYTAPIVKFTADNVEYRATYFRPMEKKLNIGQKVNVQFNPENPYEYIIIGDRYLHTNSISAQSTGLLLIGLGIFLLLMNLGIIG